MKIVRAKINTTAIREAIAKVKEHTVVASSRTLHSFSLPSALEIPLIRLKDNRYNKSDITTGRVIITIAIIATTPHELFIKERLEDIVFSESLKNPPTIGIKLPMANRAVRSESVSTPCVNTLWKDITKEKIDIKKAHTPVKVFFINLDIPLKSIPPEIELTIEKHRQIFITGTRETAMKF